MDSIDEVLASETRREILERLSEKNHRPADLSRELNKDKSTIVEHLEKLRQAGLVERMEREGHKWVFYRLSRDGESFFPNRRRRLVFLAIAFISIIGAMLSMFAYMGEPAGTYADNAAPSAKTYPDASGTGPAQGEPAPMPLVGAGIANETAPSAGAGEKSANATQVRETGNASISAPVFQQSRSETYVYAAVCLLAVFLVAAAQFVLTRANTLTPPRK